MPRTCIVNTSDKQLEGKWVGGYMLDQTWRYAQAHFQTDRGAIQATVALPLEGVTEQVPVQSEGDHAHFALPGTPTAALVFDGQHTQGTLSGAVQQGTVCGTFQLRRIASIPPDMLTPYTGVYRFGPDRLVSIAPAKFLGNEESLIYLDFTSRGFGLLYPVSDLAFFAGPSLLVPFPVTLYTTFMKDNQGQVIGVHWQPAAGASAAGTKLPVRREEVRFRSGDLTLAGTLTLPAASAPHPAVVLIHGSGPLDRDGDLSLLRFHADLFACHGLAVLAYDKRGVAASEGDLDQASVDDLAADALAGVRFLQRRNDIQRKQVGLWGISQGGWIAPLAASQSQEVAFLILVSGPAVSIERQDLDRIEYTLRADGFSEAEIQQAVAHQRLFFQVVRTGQGWDNLQSAIEKARGAKWAAQVALPASEAEFNEARDWWRRFRFDFDPVPILEQVTCPVLALFGERDTLVPAKHNIALMAQALTRGGNQDYTLQVIPHASHIMTTVDAGGLADLPVSCGKCVCGYPEPSRRSPHGSVALLVSLLGMFPAMPVPMIFLLLAHAFSVLLDLIWLGRRAEHDKDVEILLLRQQLRILQRKQPHPPRISRWEKVTLLVLASKLTVMTNSARTRLSQVVLLFKPETLLKWHRELVRRKWTFKQQAPRGRPPISAELEALILRLARENPTWGYGKLEGELGKLGYDIGRSTIRDLLKRRRIPPAPERGKHGSSWRTFLAHYQGQILACDFFTVETAWLKIIYVLFGIELGSRRVHLAGCTANPTSAWVTGYPLGAARQLSWQIQDGRLPVRFLIHDRDSKFPAAFDMVFISEDATIIRTPIRAPNANAFAERWLRSVREECLDKILILAERHLHRVLTMYVDYYNHARPGTLRVQGIEQQCPVPLVRSAARDGPIERRDLLGGMLHDYYRRAA